MDISAGAKTDSEVYLLGYSGLWLCAGIDARYGVVGAWKQDVIVTVCAWVHKKASHPVSVTARHWDSCHG
jgi:hypothetical protein